MTIHQLTIWCWSEARRAFRWSKSVCATNFSREPSRAVDPDLAVALGAAVQAAMIDGRSVGPVLVDVTGHTLGIEACVGMTFQGPEMVFSPIIHRNTPLPARYEQAYSTLYDDQKEVVIHVLQGERPEVHRNRSIGKFRLPLESGGGDRSKIVVRFDLTLDGTLKVTATQPATGLSRELIVDNAAQPVSSRRAEPRGSAPGSPVRRLRRVARRGRPAVAEAVGHVGFGFG